MPGVARSCGKLPLTHYGTGYLNQLLAGTGDEGVSRTYLKMSEQARDFLYHLGYELPADVATLRFVFTDVRVVLMSGTKARAQLLIKEYMRLSSGSPLAHIKDWCRSERYHLYKFGKVLSLAHGIGTGSILVVLHEVLKALVYAGAENFVFVRVGSSGGLGLKGGTVVVTSQPVNGVFEPVLEMEVLGKRVQYEAAFDSGLSRALLEEGERLYGCDCVLGKTMSCKDFYDSQGRMNGAFCDFDEEQQEAFLKKCQMHHILNFEMESLALAAFSKRARITAACVCVVLVDRAESDSVDAPKNVVEEWDSRPVQLVVNWIVKKLSSESNSRTEKS